MCPCGRRHKTALGEKQSDGFRGSGGSGRKEGQGLFAGGKGGYGVLQVINHLSVLIV